MGDIRILLVDDDKSIQGLYDKGLDNAVFSKRFADNGKTALEIYDIWHPHVIVMDITMPVMAGYSMLQEIREKKRDRSTIIIMATSSTDSKDIRDCISLGIQGYIIKPFKLKQIGDTILNYMRQDRLK